MVSYTATKNADDLGRFECGEPKESGSNPGLAFWLCKNWLKPAKLHLVPCNMDGFDVYTSLPRRRS